jgi:hypothetical protein
VAGPKSPFRRRSPKATGDFPYAAGPLHSSFQVPARHAPASQLASDSFACIRINTERINTSHPLPATFVPMVGQF